MFHLYQISSSAGQDFIYVIIHPLISSHFSEENLANCTKQPRLKPSADSSKTFLFHDEQIKANCVYKMKMK